MTVIRCGSFCCLPAEAIKNNGGGSRPPQLPQTVRKSRWVKNVQLVEAAVWDEDTELDFPTAAAGSLH